jgi:hypothetical protein
MHDLLPNEFFPTTFHCEIFQLLVGMIIDVFFIDIDDHLIMIFESKKKLVYLCSLTNCHIKI